MTVGNSDSFHIAIDVGSTSVKGAVLDLEANEVTSVCSLPFPSPVGDCSPAQVEIEPQLVVDCVENLVQRLSQGMPGCGHLWVCGQMGGVVLSDDRGNALSRYISWRDQRSIDIPSSGKSWLQLLREAWPDDVWSSLGRELQPGSTSTLLYWLNEHAGLSPNVIPCSIADYVIAKLTNSPPSMHTTYAIGLLDLHQVDWHREALSRIGLAKVNWPVLIHGLDAIGRFRMAGRSYEVHGCFGDHQTALWGAGLEREELSINASTGSQVSYRTPTFEPGAYQSRLFFDGDWLNTVTHLPAGRALNALVQLLSELSEAEGVTLQNTWKTIAQKTAETADTDAVANINYYACPLGSSGSFSQLTIENLTVGNLFLSAIKTMADNYRAVAQQMAPSKSFRALVLSGGLAQSLPRLVDFIRNRFSLPIREVHGEDTLLGLLKLARHFSAPSSTCS